MPLNFRSPIYSWGFLDLLLVFFQRKLFKKKKKRETTGKGNNTVSPTAFLGAWST